MSDQYLRVNYTFPLHQGCTHTHRHLGGFMVRLLAGDVHGEEPLAQTTNIGRHVTAVVHIMCLGDRYDNGEKLVMNVGACLRCFLLEAPSNGGATFVQPQGFEYMVFGIACS